MTPGQLDLIIYQGATWRKTIRVQSPAGTGVDLTDATLQMQIRPAIASTEIIIELSTANGRIVVTDASKGEFVVEIEDEASSQIDQTKGVYDLEVHYPNGDVDRILMGKVTLSKEVTR